LISHKPAKRESECCEQGITSKNSSLKLSFSKTKPCSKWNLARNRFCSPQSQQNRRIFSMNNHENYRNEIKAYIVRAGMTMSEVVEVLADEYGWSSSVPNLSGKLKRGSLRYGEAVELADVLGYDIVWQKRRK